MLKLRPSQVKIIRDVVRKFGYRDNVVVSAPTGIGKTVVGQCVAKEFDSAFYTTPQISLLEQIERDPYMREVAVLKGRKHYWCPVGECTADVAPCRRGVPCKELCEYRRRKMRVVNSHIGALSFAFMIVDGFLPDDINLGKRELLIIDENDGLEGWLVEFGSFRIRCDYVRDLYELKDWCKDEIKRLTDKRNELLKDGSKEAMKKAEKIGKRIWKLNTFMECDEGNYVMEWRDGVAKVVPIDVRELAEKLIYWRADKRLLMSATNLNLKDTCLCNGLDRKRTAFIEAKHPFRKENRMIIYRPVAKMTKDERYKNFDRMAEEVERIVNEHSGEKGIIHCHSYEIANEIHKRLDGLCDIHSSDDRNEAIRRFMDGDIEVLVAVGFERGIDLKGDICRWQIICKVPYPDMSDLRVRELLVNRGMWNWFRGQAIKNLIQACGRGVRDFDDWCVTYVLDESFGNLIRYKRMFPKWFLEAVVHEERRQDLV